MNDPHVKKMFIAGVMLVASIPLLAGAAASENIIATAIAGFIFIGSIVLLLAFFIEAMESTMPEDEPEIPRPVGLGYQTGPEVKW